MAITPINQYNEFVAIKAALLKVIVIKVRFFKFTAAILIIDRIVKPAPEYTMLIIVAETGHVRLNEPLHGLTAHLELIGQLLRMYHEQFVSSAEVSQKS